MRTLIYILLTVFICCACSSRSDLAKRQKDEIIHLDMRGDSLTAYASVYNGPVGSAIFLKTNPVGLYPKVFNDSNITHWTAAEKIGIDPLKSLRSHWQLKNPITKIGSCADFYIEPLTHSVPFLVKQGSLRLHEIGRRFRDSLSNRGGGDYRIRVTSVTRTSANVKRLRRRNRNAVDSSVHQLGTTFDISYSSFAISSPEVPRNNEQLKALLAEVLFAMQQEGKILVKYEKKQPCFHVTAVR